MSKGNWNDEGCGSCFFEIFGELAIYVILFFVGCGALLLFGFLPEDIDQDTIVLIGVGALVAPARKL
jgi:hypothetical protein